MGLRAENHVLRWCKLYDRHKNCFKSALHPLICSEEETAYEPF
jgi:hypothetical protein